MRPHGVSGDSQLHRPPLPAMDVPEDDDAPIDLASWREWPVCPQCGQRRQARCPTCGFASEQIPLADYQELGVPTLPLLDRSGRRRDPDAGQPAVLLMCPHCEEAFQPRFYDRCAACGYDFEEGIQVNFVGDDTLTPRVVGVAAALLAFILGLFFYFRAIVNFR